MEVNQYDDQYKVYMSAEDRIVKKTHDKIYEVYHITTGDDQNVLSISTIDFNDLETDQIKSKLAEIGFNYDADQAKLINQLNAEDVIVDNEKLIDYVVADKLSISGHNYDTIKFVFENMNQLNEILLEHDIPVRYDQSNIEFL